MRLIDADALLEKMKRTSRYFSAKFDIEEMPTIEAEPVKHGRWIFETINNREHMKCSKCLKSQTPTGVFAYCPNCGAKMDLKEECL